MSENASDLNALTADVAAAYLANNNVATTSLTDVIRSIKEGLRDVAPIVEEPVADKPVPKVDPRKSIAKDGATITSLEDGKPYKALKRHLASLGLTPEQYRTKWGLAADYPMVAPAYSKQRAELARAAGLGNNRKAAAAAPSDGGVV